MSASLKRLYSLSNLIYPRLFPILFGIVTVYAILYLLWTNPASHDSARKKRDKLLAASRSHVNQQAERVEDVDVQIEKQNQLSMLQFAPHWKGVWVPDRKVQVMSVIRDIHHKAGTRLVLPSFLQHSSNRDFNCCVHWSSNKREYIQVPAQLDYIDLRFIADFQAATFECLLKQSELKAVLGQITHISFSAESCESNPTMPMKILTPKRRKFEFAVCTKVAYGRLEPQRLLEWFSFMESLGVSKVLVFYNNLHPHSRKVLNFYEEKGLVELIPFDPRNTVEDGSVYYTEANGQTRQSQQDKTLAVRDSQYRLAGYDFVLTIDFDEIPVPIRPYSSINWVLQDLLRNHPDASGFYMDPYLMPPDWVTNTNSTLFHIQFTSGINVSPHGRKWAYIPARTWMAATHQSVPHDGYKVYPAPESMLQFLHFRPCKGIWADINCSNLTGGVNVSSLLRFSGRVMEKLRQLPLKDLLPQDVSLLASRSGRSFLDLVHRESQRIRRKKSDNSVYGLRAVP